MRYGVSEVLRRIFDQASVENSKASVIKFDKIREKAHLTSLQKIALLDNQVDVVFSDYNGERLYPEVRQKLLDMTVPSIG